jgi:hypothetical protein
VDDEVQAIRWGMPPLITADVYPHLVPGAKISFVDRLDAPWIRGATIRNDTAMLGVSGNQ